MRWFYQVLVILYYAQLSLCMASAEELPSDAESAPVSFIRNLAPILQDQCVGCHGSTKAKGRYRVHQFSDMLDLGADGNGSDYVEPGAAESSEFFLRLVTEDSDERMPQDADPLTSEQVALFRRWIDQGALYDGENPDRPWIEDRGYVVEDPMSAAAPESYPHPLPLNSWAMFEGERFVVLGGVFELLVWDRQKEAIHQRFPLKSERVSAISQKPGSTLIAVSAGSPGRSGELWLVDWNAEQQALENSWLVRRFPDEILRNQWSNSGSWLAVCGASSWVWVWNWSDLEASIQEAVVSGGNSAGSVAVALNTEPALSAEAHADWIQDLTFTHDSSYLVTASRDGVARVLDMDTLKWAGAYRGHEGPVHGVVAHPAESRVASLGNRGAVHFWDPGKPESKSNKKRPYNWVSARGLHVAGTQLALTSMDGKTGWLAWNGKSVQNEFEVENVEMIQQKTARDTGGWWVGSKDGLWIELDSDFNTQRRNSIYSQVGLENEDQ